MVCAPPRYIYRENKGSKNGCYSSLSGPFYVCLRYKESEHKTVKIEGS